MADLKIGKTNVTKLLKEKYKKLGKGWFTLIEVPTSEHMSVNAEAIKILVNELNYSCVYITLSKTPAELDKIFKNKNVNLKNLYYVDAISKMYGESLIESKRVVYTAGPLDIDALSVSIREILSSIQANKKCVFLDSVTAILLYNTLPRAIRFSKFLTSTLKQIGVDGILVSITKGETTKKLTSELQKLSDEYVVITKGGGRY